MKLIFIYNANTGVFNLAADIAHKLLSPGTYSCNLCSLTHNSFSEKKEWGEYIQGLNVETEFLHKDQFKKRHLYGGSFPVIFIDENNKLTILIESKELASFTTMDELKSAIERALDEKIYK